LFKALYRDGEGFGVVVCSLVACGVLSVLFFFVLVAALFVFVGEVAKQDWWVRAGHVRCVSGCDVLVQWCLAWWVPICCKL
jgi:hypothetical protein